jgi:hypothetical protein
MQRGVEERSPSSLFFAYRRTRRETAPDSKGFYRTSYEKEEVVFAHPAIQGFYRSRGFTYQPEVAQGEVLKTPQRGTNQ